jgi:hypothetical protein
MPKNLRDIIAEETNAAATLRPKSKSFDELGMNKAASDAIEAYKVLNQNQAVRHREMVKQILQGQAWAKSGAGIPDPENLAKKNRASIRSEEEETAMDYFAKLNVEHRRAYLEMIEEIQKEEQKEELAANLECCGFSQENQKKVENLFYEAAENSPLKRGLVKLLEAYCPSPFFSQKKLDVIELLAERINELESVLEVVETESASLREEIRLKEATESLKREERTPKKSVVAEYMEFVDESNSELMREEPYVDPRMKSYIDAIKRTTQH